MPGIDQSRQFIPLRIAVLTVSDTRSLEEDKSGATLAERIEKSGHAVGARVIVTDDVEKIRAQVKAWVADPAVDVILTTGGQSYPGSGTTGDGYAFAAAFGHTIVPPRPSLVPLKVDAPWVAGLRGVTLPKL